MCDSAAAKVLLVRVIEEDHGEVITDTAHAAALADAGDCDEPSAWFVRRADALLDRLPHSDSYGLILNISQLPDSYRLPVLAVAFGVGLISNHFGPTGKIHILFNPIMALVAWNLLLYVVLVLSALKGTARASKEGTASTQTSSTESGGNTPPENRAARPLMASERSWKPWPFSEGLWRRWLTLRTWYADARATGNEYRKFAQIAASFSARWFTLARTLTILRVERMIHLAALGMVTGALAGMYFRGLFLDYNVVWRSTFIRSEPAIAFLTTTILRPTARLLGVNLATQLDIRQLTGETGVPAATWIHLYSLTALLVIVIPRTLLYGFESLQIRMLTSQIEPNLADDYFQSRLRLARDSRQPEIHDYPSTGNEPPAYRQLLDLLRIQNQQREYAAVFGKAVQFWRSPAQVFDATRRKYDYFVIELLQKYRVNTHGLYPEFDKAWDEALAEGEKQIFDYDEMPLALRTLHTLNPEIWVPQRFYRFRKAWRSYQARVEVLVTERAAHHFPTHRK